MNPARNAANPRAALVVFCRRPVPGVGKQRLARGLGREAAHAVATALLACTLEDLDDWAGPVVLSPADTADLDWARALLAARPGLHPRSCVVPQPEANLGERLEAVDRGLRGAGFDMLFFIGADAPALPRTLFATALAALARADVVLAPARDGGVTLMGARRPWPALAALPWSTADLGAALAAACATRGDALQWLEASFDVDEPDDLDAVIGALADDPRPARRALLTLARTLRQPRRDATPAVDGRTVQAARP